MLDEKISAKRARSLSALSVSEKPSFKDEEIYLAYEKRDIDKGYSINEPKDFVREAQSAVFDVCADDQDGLKRAKSKMHWDKKKKKFVRPVEEAKSRMIRTESGRLIPATYKSNLYSEWRKKNHVSLPQAGETELDARTLGMLRKQAARDREDEDEDEDEGESGKREFSGKRESRNQSQKNGKKKTLKSELKDRSQILKSRKIEERKKQRAAPKKFGSAKKGARKGGRK